MTDRTAKVSLRWLLLIALTALLFGASGCASDEDLTSSRPWNRPTGWETGLPAQLLEGR